MATSSFGSSWAAQCLQVFLPHTCPVILLTPETRQNLSVGPCLHYVCVKKMTKKTKAPLRLRVVHSTPRNSEQLMAETKKIRVRTEKIDHESEAGIIYRMSHKSLPTIIWNITKGFPIHCHCIFTAIFINPSWLGCFLGKYLPLSQEGIWQRVGMTFLPWTGHTSRTHHTHRTPFQIRGLHNKSCIFWNAFVYATHLHFPHFRLFDLPILVLLSKPAAWTLHPTSTLVTYLHFQIHVPPYWFSPADLSTFCSDFGSVSAKWKPS